MAANCAGPGQSLLSYGSSQEKVCVCSPGFLWQHGACVLFPSNTTVPEQSTFYYQPKLTTSARSDAYGVQRKFLWATSAAISAWLLLCGILRCFPLRGPAFRLRYFVSRLDYRFWRRHWHDEQKVQVKRKTELGGAFSVASYLFLIGLGASFVYEQVARSSITQETVVPSQLSDLLLFQNDIEFNVTTVSNMLCSQFVANTTARTGVLSKLQSLTALAQVSSTMACHDTDTGPLVRIFCSQCPTVPDNTIYAFKFIDAPGSPAIASGLKFVVTSYMRGQRSVVKGVLDAGSDGLSAKNSSLRGNASSILNFRLVPRLFKSHDNLRLMQTTFHQFTTGSFVSNVSELATSLTAPGEVRVAVWSQVLSSYIVESETQNISGLVTFIARIGGIYGLSVSVFFFLMYELEYHIPLFRYDDKALQAMHARHMAKRRWRSLRLYVRHLVDWDLLRTVQGVGLPSHGSTPGEAREQGREPGSSISASRLTSDAPLLGSSALNAARGKSSEVDNAVRESYELGVLPLLSKDQLEESTKDLHPPTRTELRKLRRSAAAVQSLRERAVKRSGGQAEGLRQKQHHSMLSDLSHTAPAKALMMPANALTSVLDEAVSRCEDLTGIHIPHVHIPGTNHQHTTDGHHILLRKRKRTLTGSGSSHTGSVVRQYKKPSWLASDDPLPCVPDMEEEEEAGEESLADKEPDVDTMYGYLQDIIAYDARLRDDFLRFQSMLENVVQRFRPHSNL